MAPTKNVIMSIYYNFNIPSAMWGKKTGDVSFSAPGSSISVSPDTLAKYCEQYPSIVEPQKCNSEHTPSTAEIIEVIEKMSTMENLEKGEGNVNVSIYYNTKVPVGVMVQSKMVKNMIKDIECEDPLIPISGTIVGVKQLEYIIEFCTHYYESPRSTEEILKTDKQIKNRKNCFDEWDTWGKNYVGTCSAVEKRHLILVANFMNIPDLLNLCAMSIAQNISKQFANNDETAKNEAIAKEIKERGGKPPRKFYTEVDPGVANVRKFAEDFSEIEGFEDDEWEKIEEEIKWAFTK